MANAAETSFSNNFWSHDEAGLQILVGRMHNAKQTCEEVKAFYKERVALEEDYSKRLTALSKRPLGSAETATLKDSLESIRRETEAMGVSHSQAASHMKGNLEEPFIAFANGIRERRKATEGTIEKLSKARMTQWHNLEKSQERYESECNKIKACIAQGNLLVGKDYDKNQLKLEKLRANVEVSKREYQTCLRVFQETAERWKSEWRLACDRFQDLEEERIDFLKASFWNYTNIASIACVSDDECCENIRLSLEKCDLMADITSFVAANATSQRIPEAPGFINFMEGDFSEDAKENAQVSNFERSSTAQLHAFNKTGPSKTSNHNNNSRDPDQDLAIIEPNSIDNKAEVKAEVQSIPSPLTREALDALHKSISQQSLHQQEHAKNKKEGDSNGNGNAYSGYAFENISIRPPQPKSNSSNTSPVPPLSSPEQGYESSLYSQPTTISNGDLDAPYVDKAGRNHSSSPQRNGRSRPQSSDIDNYVCVSPFERRRANTYRSENSATPTSDRAASPIKGFGDHLRKTSLRQIENQGSPSKSSAQSTPTRDYYYSNNNNTNADKIQRPPSRSANFLARTESGGAYSGPPSKSNTQPQEVLNIGGNMFPVRDAQPDSRYQETVGASASELTRRNDPLNEALRALKGELPIQQSDKPSSAPTSAVSTPKSSPIRLRGAATTQMSSPTPYMESPNRAYGGIDDRSSRNLHHQMRPAPQSHRRVNDNYGQGTGNRLADEDLSYRMARFEVGSNPERQMMAMDNRDRMARPQQRYQQPMIAGSNSTGNIHNENASREGQFEAQNRMMMMQQSKSYGGGELDQARRYKGENTMMAEDGNRFSRQPQQQQRSEYGYAHAKQRSRSAVDPRRKPMATAAAMVDQLPRQSSDGRPIIRHVQALYDYKAAIPEEIGFRRGDTLSVLRMQQDGWWEVEILGAPGRIGLAPSNFTRPI